MAAAPDHGRAVPGEPAQAGQRFRPRHRVVDPSGRGRRPLGIHRRRGCARFAVSCRRWRPPRARDSPRWWWRRRTRRRRRWCPGCGWSGHPPWPACWRGCAASRPPRASRWPAPWWNSCRRNQPRPVRGGRAGAPRPGHRGQASPPRPGHRGPAETSRQERRPPRPSGRAPGWTCPRSSASPPPAGPPRSAQPVATTCPCSARRARARPCSPRSPRSTRWRGSSRTAARC